MATAEKTDWVARWKRQAEDLDDIPTGTHPPDIVMQIAPHKGAITINGCHIPPSDEIQHLEFWRV